MKTIIKHLFLLSIIATLFGCCLLPSRTTGVPLPEAELVQIEGAGKTKYDLYEWLGGPPTSILARGETAVIPSGMVHPGGGGFVWYGGTYSIDADTFFELFSGDHEITENHRIYYYRRAASRQWFYIVPLFPIIFTGEQGSILTDSLWVLVNEENGMIEDYLFRKEKKLKASSPATDSRPSSGDDDLFED